MITQTAKASDWKTEPLPDKRMVIPLSLSYAQRPAEDRKRDHPRTDGGQVVRVLRPGDPQLPPELDGLLCLPAAHRRQRSRVEFQPSGGKPGSGAIPRDRRRCRREDDPVPDRHPAFGEAGAVPLRNGTGRGRACNLVVGGQTLPRRSTRRRRIDGFHPDYPGPAVHRYARPASPPLRVLHRCRLRSRQDRRGELFAGERIEFPA